MRRIATFVVTLTAGVIALTGCDGGSDTPEAGATTPAPAPATTAVDAATTAPPAQPHKLVLTAKGTGDIYSFVYVLDGKATRGGSARLPWRQSVDVPADGRRHEWSLTIDYRDGTMNLVAYFNGQQIMTSSGRSSGEGHAAISGGVQG